MAQKNAATYFGLSVMAFLAVAVGTVSLRYALPHIPAPATLDNLVTRHGMLVAHATFASIALLCGPWQFFPGLRNRHLKLHRWSGRVYCVAVACGWISSLPIAMHAQTGAVASAGFLGLGLFWIVTTAMGWLRAVEGRIPEHRRWMIRSYALTAAAITLRIYLPLSFALGLRFERSYPAIAWLCWVPNVLVAEWLIGGRVVSGAATKSDGRFA